MSAPPKTGKGKKKTKDPKITLEEFNKIEAPLGHSIVSIPGLDWAATMAEHDSIKQTDKQILLPQAPRALRAPNLDPEQLPKEPPFKVVLNSLPFGATELDIADRFFKGIAVKNVEVNRGMAIVELETSQDQYEALCKSGASLRNKEVSVSLYGQSNFGGSIGFRSAGYGDRYNSRQGERSGFRIAAGPPGGYGTDEPDRTDSDWRSAPRPTPPTQMYNNDRMGGQRSQYGSRRSYDSENRNKYEGRSSYPEKPGFSQNSNQNRDSYSDRGDDRFSRHRMMNDRPPERDFANVRREARPIINDRNSSYPAPRVERDSYNSDRMRQAPPSDSSHYAPTESVQSQQMASNALGTIDEPRSITPQSSSQNRPLLDGPNSEPVRRTEPARRPALNLQKRTKPIEPEVMSRNPAIFGQAKPVDTTLREREIEEKLKAMSVEKQQPDQSDKPASAPRSRRVSEAVSETSSNTMAKE